MRFEKHTRLGLRVFSLLVVCGAFASLVACGKDKRKKVEEGPRIAAIYLSSGNNGAWNQAGWTAGVNNGNCPAMTVEIANGSDSQRTGFQIQPTLSPSWSQPSYIGPTEYVLQSVALDQYCDRLAFMVVQRAYGWGGNGGWANQGGYGGGDPRYVAGQASKAYLFRRTAEGRLEQLRVANGYWQNIQEALPSLGAQMSGWW